MKKVKLERELMVPDTGYCIMWKNHREVCNKLMFGKIADKPELIWKCTFFDMDLKSNIDSFGIKKCCEISNNKATLHELKLS